MPHEIMKSLKSKRKQLVGQLTKINNAIAALEPVIPNEMHWKKKAIDCLNFRKKFSQTPEMLDCMLGEDMVAKLTDDQRKKYTNALSVALIAMRNDTTVVMFVLRGFRGYWYGLPQWFDGGKPKKEFMSDNIKYLDTDKLMTTGRK